MRSQVHGQLKIYGVLICLHDRPYYLASLDAIFTHTSVANIQKFREGKLDDLVEEIGSDFDVAEQSEDVDTLGGLIFSELGRVPARGEVVQAVPGFEFQVLDADPRRIKRLRVRGFSTPRISAVYS